MPDIIPPENVAGAAWGIMRADNAGAIQTFRGPQRFTHAETGTGYSSAHFAEDPNRIKLAPLRLYAVRTDTRPDARWFENHAAALAVDDSVPEIHVTWTADLKPFSPDLVTATRGRIWADKDARLEATDRNVTRGETHPTAYRDALEAAYVDAMAALDIAADSTAAARAEANYGAAADALARPDPNPWI